MPFINLCAAMLLFTRTMLKILLKTDVVWTVIMF